MSQNDSNKNVEKFLVRQFRPDDLSRVQEIFSNGLTKYNDGGQTSSPLFVAAKLKTDMADIQESYINVKGGNFWVAEDVSLTSPRIVGIVGILPRLTTDDKHPVTDDVDIKPGMIFELQRLSVDQDYQGTGVAQLLLGTLEKFAFVKHKCLKVFLTTGVDRKQACRFYEKQGYKKTHTESYNIKDRFGGDMDYIKTIQYFEKSSESC